jgi:hypothetical protein
MPLKLGMKLDGTDGNGEKEAGFDSDKARTCSGVL